jgi:hypothetical protein
VIGNSAECAGGRHHDCPGFYKAKTCRCACHQPQSAVCAHPADAAQWDDHRAILRCSACGREVGDGSEEGPSAACSVPRRAVEGKRTADVGLSHRTAGGLSSLGWYGPGVTVTIDSHSPLTAGSPNVGSLGTKVRSTPERPLIVRRAVNGGDCKVPSFQPTRGVTKFVRIRPPDGAIARRPTFEGVITPREGRGPS